jgi:hypothetical protein
VRVTIDGTEYVAVTSNRATINGVEYAELASSEPPQVITDKDGDPWRRRPDGLYQYATCVPRTREQVIRDFGPVTEG